MDDPFVFVAIAIWDRKNYCLTPFIASLETLDYPREKLSIHFAVEPSHPTPLFKGLYEESLERMRRFKRRLRALLKNSLIENWSIHDAPVTEGDYGKNLVLYNTPNASGTSQLFTMEPIIKSRRYLRKLFLKTSHPFCFVIDSDNPLPRRTLKTLIPHLSRDDMDIVSPLIYDRFPDPDTGEHRTFMRNYLCRPDPTDALAYDSWKLIYFFDEVPPEEWKTFVKVDIGPASCALIKRKVMEKIEWEPGVICGEDVEFYHRCNLAGFNSYVDTSIVVPHITAEGEWITSRT